MTKKFYDNVILKYPVKVLLILLLGICFLGFYATKLQIDASAESLLLDDDKDLQFSRLVNKRYYNPNFLVVTYTTQGDLLSNKNLENIKKLSIDLEKVSSISSVTSILNVPLLQSPVVSLTDLASEIRTLEKSDVNKELVKKEFLNSELYSNMLVSNDFKTTAIVLNLKEDKTYTILLEKRNALLAKKRANTISQEEEKELDKVVLEFKKHRDEARVKEHETINQIREILKNHKDSAKLFLGGVNMIADDIVGFVKNDLLVYGSALFLILCFILWVIFRQIIWIVLPVIICILSVISTTGVLGLYNLEVTVISSNFIALQLIITISIVLHLIVRYEELCLKYKNASQYKLVINTMLSKFNPSFFAIITTIAGFGSLVLSGIQPVKNLGWMMSAGIAISLLISFIIFPIFLILRKKINVKEKSKSKINIIPISSNLVQNHGFKIIIASILLVIFSLTGAFKLIVENSFINYFKKDTEIYQSMKVIDENLGGTTPLDVIITFPKKETKIQSESEDEFDSFEDEFNEEASSEQYWFTNDKMDVITKVHDYLENNPYIGKVQSFATLLKVGKVLNEDKELDSFKLALLYNEVPNEYRKLILEPYINIENNQARITMRIIDSNPNLRRDELIKQINSDLKEIINNDKIEYRLSNIMIMYNNMLQSLFDSQIKTLGFVILILFVMFLILFKSLKVAFIAILANLVPISIIFGIMGWLNIPLDIMTITIAAISIGIGVDDTIHYIHRFKEEYKLDHNYLNAMKRSHQSIGYAMTYTSLVVMVGFSILLLSNLIPTIYFGLLTVVVMATILASALLLLPKLLILLKPYK